MAKNKKKPTESKEKKKSELLSVTEEQEQLVHESEPRKKKKKRDSEATEAKGETVQHPGGEDLSPEERRVLERKLKKERKKEAKKLMREAGVGGKKEDPKKPSGSELALQYLLSWSERPKHWKFQKTRQTWLLLHMYDREKVPDKYFSILLEYLEGLQGGARELTVQKAEAIMKKDEDGADSEDGALLEKLERARKILQLLS
ncbi:uncharacterized protein C7orf50 homolog isoform X3 [Rhinatrema bivittatum]|uniref:uncharacterized protein C7orf50 homolog isoform X3 n=1 Tax=Rhinatrema bivittatum TaxID=194408 RepID=UPI00112B0F32|nr:uncharacterized protein C7orf50 homolog isoform X3 [Rhinatrema bivittatum]XP_029432896.1 uncharacterized protein C7orf50 homolog isoform X3 [Rhinatrema bivittatum]XP_029432897.1 uncharacterized protein C7orf50 homolog isoform X3 [Rhinatrema bivittatum]XP_029432898.1 uncharacterized protein C7orf50 homolog isoform X3 [Rhinatrema bivittatum]